MVRTALRTLDRTLDVQTTTRNVYRKLELGHLTPVKSSHLQGTDRWVTAESRLLFISKCDQCNELVQPVNRMIPRLMCHTPLGLPVEYAINEQTNYDATVLGKFPVSFPTPAELIFFGKHIYRSRPHNETRPSHP